MPKIHPTEFLNHPSRRSSDDNEESLSRSNSGRNIAVHDVSSMLRLDTFRSKDPREISILRRSYFTSTRRGELFPRSFVNNRLACETSKVNISTNEDFATYFVVLLFRFVKNFYVIVRQFGGGNNGICRFKRLNLKKEKKNKFQVTSIKEGTLLNVVGRKNLVISCE